jgi:uncharacterized protein (DUF1697 family)
MKYAALIRGINVSGNNITREDELISIFKAAGCKNIHAYTQSDTVICECHHIDRAKIIQSVESLFEKRFSYSVQVILRTQEELKEILYKIPEAWKTEADVRRYIAYLSPELNAHDVAAAIPENESISPIIAGNTVLYMDTQLEGLTKNKLKKVVGKELYGKMILRNYVASKKLLELLFTELV